MSWSRVRVRVRVRVKVAGTEKFKQKNTIVNGKMGTLQALELLCVAGAERASDLFPGLASYLCSEGFVLRLFQLLRGVERGWEILKKYPPSIFIQGKNSCT